MRRWKRALFQLLVFVLVLTNIELYCYNRLIVERLETAQPLIERNVHSGFRVRPHLDNVPGAMNDTVTTNSDGLRDTEVAGPPAPDELRILCVGGSQTYGWGLPFEMSWPRRLEEELRRRAPGTNIRVINGGQPGYNTGDGAGLIEELGDRYKPGVVVAMFGFNDYTGLPFTPSRIKSPTVVRTSRLLQWSATYRYLCWKLLKPKVEADPSKLPAQFATLPNWMQVTLQNLLALKQVCDVQDARLLFCAEVMHPDARSVVNVTAAPTDAEYAQLEDAYLAFSTWSEVPVLLMREVYRASGLPVERFFQDASPVHTSEVGHRMEAARIADELIRLGWVPGAKQ